MGIELAKAEFGAVYHGTEKNTFSTIQIQDAK